MYQVVLAFNPWTLFPAAMAHSTASSNRSTPRLSVNELLDNLNSKVPYLKFTIDHSKDFKAYCLELLRHVFPDWNQDLIKLVQCTEGITNKRK